MTWLMLEVISDLTETTPVIHSVERLLQWYQLNITIEIPDTNQVKRRLDTIYRY